MFMFEVAKHKGGLYPTSSLGNLLRAIGRLIRLRIVKRVGKRGFRFKV